MNNATELRRDYLQGDLERSVSDSTRIDLEEAFRRTRKDMGGISLMEIAEVMKESFCPAELQAIKNSL